MKMLALEFSSSKRSVAVAADGVVRAYAEVQVGRTTPALSLVEQALHEAKVTREEITRVAVGLGPGSYTGIRLALALAQGFAMRGGVSGIGVSSVLALASNVLRQGVVGPFHLVVDAQRGEFYLGDFEVAPGTVRELRPLQIVGAGKVKQLIQAGRRVVGPDVADELPGVIAEWPDARAVARLASETQTASAVESLKPIYLRDSSFRKLGGLVL